MSTTPKETRAKTATKKTKSSSNKPKTKSDELEKTNIKVLKLEDKENKKSNLLQTKLDNFNKEYNQDKANKSQTKKKFYKRPWFWILFVLTFLPLWWAWLIFGFIMLITSKSVRKLFKSIINFAKSHKKISIGIIAALMLIIIAMIIIGAIERSIEEGRDYFIKVDSEFTFDCDAYINYDNVYCKERSISGTFSKYPSTEMDKLFVETNGDTFEYRATHRIYHEKQDFNIDELADGEDKTVTLEVYNKVLDEVVAEKTVYIHYNLSQEDIAKISEQHNKWLEQKQAEEAERAQKEAEEAEKRATEERQKQEAEAQKRAEEENKKQEEAKQQQSKDNGEELPDDISPYDIKALCERGFENIGYPNASIQMTNQYAMGEPKYIYVIVGQLSYKKGITSSRVNVGAIQCQANWSDWTIKHLTVNGQQLF